jgi:hypothetical protein
MRKQLLNMQTGQAIVEFEGKNTLIHNKFLEQEMRTLGIMVPHGLRGIYHGKDCILLDDPDFQQAFQEIYYLTSMNPSQFRWADSQS